MLSQVRKLPCQQCSIQYVWNRSIQYGPLLHPGDIQGCQWSLPSCLPRGIVFVYQLDWGQGRHFQSFHLASPTILCPAGQGSKVEFSANYQEYPFQLCIYALSTAGWSLKPVLPWLPGLEKCPFSLGWDESAVRGLFRSLRINVNSDPVPWKQSGMLLSPMDGVNGDMPLRGRTCHGSQEWLRSRT